VRRNAAAGAPIPACAMRAVRLRSSMIDRAAFDEGSQELTLCFKAGRNYIYSGVPRAVFDALKSAASAGAYFNACIKGRFACRPDPPRRFRPG
jgi:hypothetical protein